MLGTILIVDRHGLPLSVSTHAANHHEVRLVQLCFDFYMIEAKPENLIRHYSDTAAYRRPADVGLFKRLGLLSRRRARHHSDYRYYSGPDGTNIATGQFWGRPDVSVQSEPLGHSHCGWLAGKVLQGGGFGLIGDLIVGLIGAFIGDWLLPQLNIHLGSGIIALIVNAFVGAVVLLLIWRLVTGWRGGSRLGRRW